MARLRLAGAARPPRGSGWTEPVLRRACRSHDDTGQLTDDLRYLISYTVRYVGREGVSQSNRRLVGGSSFGLDCV